MVENIKTDVDRQVLVWKIMKGLNCFKSIENFFLLSKPKVVYLRPFSSSLQYHKF